MKVKEQAEAKQEDDKYQIIKKKQDLEQSGLAKGTQYNDLSKAA